MAGSQSLDRGIAVLELLDASTRPIGVREISRQLDLSPAIVQRLLKTLVAHNYVRQDEDTRRYSIGYRALSLGTSLERTDNIIVAAHGELQKLASNHMLNGYLGTLQGNRAVYLLSVQSAGPVAIRNDPGEVTHLHTTAMGKVLLASLTDEQAANLLGPGPLTKVTEATITDPHVVIASLEDVRRLGYSTVVDENILGVTSVGAPIRTASGSTRAALSVAFARHFAPQLTTEAAAALVMEVAERLSKQLGYSPPT
jgi:DNA-binding IclR family transcriptional regulator